MNGVCLLDKPPEMTSFLCCAVMRRLLQEKKIGHAGTLDPMATGVLPILVGKATRAMDLLPVQDKRYTASLRFGYTSDTLDVWGKLSPTGRPLPGLREIEQALEQFRGEIRQIPPMLSALKKDGVRLYDLARQGIEIPREARPVTIHALQLVDYNPEEGVLTLDCLCSKGTYIRTLCDDLGAVLGCGAVMTSLRRTMAAGYDLTPCFTLDQAKDWAQEGTLAQHVIPVSTLFASYPAVAVTAPQAVRFRNGGALALERVRQAPSSGTVRVEDPNGLFLGLGYPADGELRVLKLFV